MNLQSPGITGGAIFWGEKNPGSAAWNPPPICSVLVSGPSRVSSADLDRYGALAAASGEAVADGEALLAGSPEP